MSLPLHRRILLTLACLLFSALLAGCSSGWVPAAQIAPPTGSPTAPEPSPTLPLEPTATPTATQPTQTASPAPTQTRTTRPTATRRPTLTASATLPALDQIATLNAQPIPGVTVVPGRRPTATRLPTRTPTKTSTPTVTPTPLPPYALLRVARPGRYSKLVSPIRTEIFAMPGEDGLIQIDLIGEDSRFITRQVLEYPNYLGRNIGIAPQVEFEIPAVAETARLVVSTNDKFGRKIAISSLELVLLTIGENEINLPVYQMEPFIIREPKRDGIFTGGMARIVGLARPVNDSPLIVQLIAEDGRVVSQRQFTVEPPSGDLSHTPFTIDLPYQVSENTPVRVTIRQESDTRIGGTVALTTVLAMLIPE